MEKRRIETYRKRLLERRMQLEAAVSRTEQDGRKADETEPLDMGDKASNSYNKEFLFKLSSDGRFIRQLVDEARGRMKNGEYGTCIHCGGEMQDKRLESVPWARHCIEYQEKQEHGLL